MSASSVQTRTGVSIALLMAAAFFAVGGRMVEVARGPLPPRPGVIAPDLAGPDLESNRVTLDAFRGRVVLVDFWATWCPPCVEMIPKLESVHREFSAQGFTVLGVNQEPDAKERVAAFLARRRITFPQVLDDGRMAASYGVHSFPTSFLVGRDGRIVAVHRGPTLERTLRREVEAALATTSTSASTPTKIAP
ncbi:MAG: TlpA family protein disulfide reductase [Deltaproteobacteria bacterium]|nr:TlpA family protein disulfide reductase [Deltaproteobacteria bacterium]